MTLELTSTEYNNFVCYLYGSQRRSDSNPMRTSNVRENEILGMLQNQTSNMEIRRVLRTSDAVINRVKKENGLWGA